MPLVCQECRRESHGAHRWAYLGSEESYDEVASVVILCPSCAVREFGLRRCR